MSTAVIITGHARTFATCIHTLKWHVLRHYPDCTFYVSTVRDADSEGMEATLRELFPTSPVWVDMVDTQPELAEPFEPVRFEPYARSVPVQAVLRQLWQNERGWSMLQDHREDESPTVIRVRPDLFFHSFEPPHPQVTFPTDAATPWWGRFGGVNDRFAILGRKAAQCYFTAYSYIPIAMKQGCPLHPESLVLAAMDLRGCAVTAKLQTEFTTLRKDGTSRPPEIAAWDLAHAALGLG